MPSRVTPVRVRPLPRRPPGPTRRRRSAGGARRSAGSTDRSTGRCAAGRSRPSPGTRTEPPRRDPYDPTRSDGGADDEAVDEAGARAPARRPTRGSTNVERVSPDPAFARLGAGTAVRDLRPRACWSRSTSPPRPRRVLRDAIHERVPRRGVAVGRWPPKAWTARALLVPGCGAAIETPLGPLFERHRLAGLDRSRPAGRARLRPAGSVEAGRRPTVRDIGERGRRHTSPSDHPLPRLGGRRWPTARSTSALGRLPDRFHRPRRPGAGIRTGADRFVVADYKTNRLTPAGGRPGARTTTTPGTLADAMVEHHYPLQALLYGVALHRYLRSQRGATGTTHGGRRRLPVRPRDDRTGGRRDGVTPTASSPGSSLPGSSSRLSRLLDGDRSAVGRHDASRGRAGGWSTEAGRRGCGRLDRRRGRRTLRGPAGRRRRPRADRPRRRLPAGPGAGRPCHPARARLPRLGQVATQVVAAQDDGRPRRRTGPPASGRLAGRARPGSRRRDGAGSAARGRGAALLRPLVSTADRLYLQRFWAFESQWPASCRASAACHRTGPVRTRRQGADEVDALDAGLR